jgi:hypothetical protein
LVSVDEFDADVQRTTTCDPDAAWLGHLGAQRSRRHRECEEHGWMQDSGAPPPASVHSIYALRDAPTGVSQEAAAVAIAELMDSITCPECPPADCG